jgi:multiple sugar transport system ATP-binding protein
MAHLQLKGIEKSYDAVPVLKGIDLEIRSGEFLVLVGPSGCGKSTLLRCIAGLETITGGDLWIGEQRVNDVAPRDRDVAMVFQSYALYPHMTVAENMGFALKLRKTPREEQDRSVLDAARILGLEDLLHRRPAELSGGQRQRVAMGRAIVRDPSVFLFDEPLSNLDAALRTQLRVELKELHQRVGATMIYVTHDQVEAMTLADRIALLNQGVLQQLGTPEELYSHPVNRFVASFMGSPGMSFLERVDPELVIGIRPHQVKLGVASGLEAQVEVVETLGFESFVHLRVGAERLVARVEGPPPQRGETRIGFTASTLFCPQTGDRIEAQPHPGLMAGAPS